MTTNETTRESRSVRLFQAEWDVAEAVARLCTPQGERVSAGLGLRTALRAATEQLRAEGRGEELDRELSRVRIARAERDR